MAELASDTIFDILSRLPVKSLARFRCVSKPWCAYIDDDYFGILHGKRAVEELTPIMYDPYLSSIVGFDITKSEEGGNIILEEKKGMSLESDLYKSCSTDSEYFVKGSCNGLLYLSLRDIIRKNVYHLDFEYFVNSLAVIHPLRKEFYKFPPMQQRLDGPYYLSEESRGLGFDISTNTFKMVCILSRRKVFMSGSSFDWISKNLCTMVHVLGMDSSWREIPQVAPYPTSGDGIFAQGCLYWPSSWLSESLGKIICFGVRNEEFTTLYPPKERCGYPVRYDQLVDLQGEVGYAYIYYDHVIEVWVLKQKQWVKHCQFSERPLPRRIKVLGRWNKDGDILIESWDILNNELKLFVYSLKNQLLEEVNVLGKKYGLCIYMYMYPASSMFSIRGINKTAHSIKTDKKQLGESFQLLNL